MPDHSPRPRREPPGMVDRARMNALALRDALLSVFGGSLVGVDALVPDGRWLASYSLASIPPWVQVVIAVLLVAGGVVTGYGVLVRGYHGRTIAPLTTILTERIGWSMLLFGWGTTAIAVYGNGRLGSTLSLIIVAMLALGCLVRMWQLWRLERQVRAEITASVRTADTLQKLRGDRR